MSVLGTFRDEEERLTAERVAAEGGDGVTFRSEERDEENSQRE